MADKIEIQVNADTTQASKAFGDFGSKIIVANQGLQLFKSAVSSISAPLLKVIDEGREFGKQMAIIKSVSNLTTKEFNALTNAAKEIGATTAFTASQAGQGLESLLKAGQDVATALDTIPNIMNLAAASGTELGSVADTVAVQMNIFKNTSLTAEQAVDLLAKTANASAQNFGHLQEALKNSSGTAAAFGIEFDDLTVILGAMADAGVRGERAGTALNGALARLANPTKAISDKLTELGIAVEDVNPKTNDFKSILDVLKNSGADVTDVLQILGQEAGPKFATLVLQGADALTKFEQKQLAANDAAKSAKEALNSLEGDFTKLSSAISGISLAVFDKIEPILRDMVQFTTMAVSGWTDLIKNTHLFDDQLNSVKNSLNTVGRFFGLTDDKSEDFAKGMDDANEASAALDHTLTGNTVSESLKEVGKLLGTTGDDADDYAKKIKAADDKSKDFDFSLKSISETALDGLSAFGSGALETLGGIGTGLAEGVAQGTGLGGFVSGFQTGGVTGSLAQGFTELILSNESMQEVMGRLSEVIGKLIEPIAEALVPVIEALIPIFEALQPVFDIIGKFIVKIVDALGPVFDALVPLLEALVPIFELLEPFLDLFAKILKGVVEILVPVLEELAPLLEALAPLLEALVDVLMPFLPLIEFAARAIATSVAPLALGIKALNGAIEIFMAGINEIKKAFESIPEALESVFNQFRLTIVNVLNPVFQFFKDTIANFLAPVFLFFVDTLNNVFKPIFQFFEDTLNNVLKPIFKFFEDILFNALQPIFKFFEDILFNALQPVFDFFQSVIFNALQPMFNFFEDIILNPLQSAFEFFKNIILGPLKAILKPFGVDLGDGGAGGLENLFSNPLPTVLPGSGIDLGFRESDSPEVLSEPTSTSNITINVSSVDPRSQTEEIRQVIEELSLTGRLALA